MKKTKVQKLYWIAISVVLVSILYFSFTYAVLENSWQKYEHIVLAERERVTLQTQKEYDILRKLNEKFQQDNLVCDNNLLKAMRNAEFQASMLHDFSLVNGNDLICSTRLGVLSSPLQLEPFNVSMAGSDIRFSASSTVFETGIPEEHKEMAVAIGNFGAYLRFSLAILHEYSWLKNASYLVVGSGHQRLYGDLDVALKSTRDGYYNTFNGWLYVSQYCDLSGICTLIQTDVIKYFAKKPAVTLLISVAYIFVIVITTISTANFHFRYISLPRQLLRGMTDSRVVCNYQPIFNLKNSRYDCIEVLCRWKNEDGDVVRPDLFIEQIEKNGQSHELTTIVFNKAIRELNSYGLLNDLAIAVNFFPSDISSGLAKKLINESHRNGLNAKVVIELTEREVDDFDSMRAEIESIRNSNGLVAIDDFGTGYSNLHQLEHLKVDKLKIDKSFIDNIENNTIRSRLVEVIVELAQTLDLLVVAEGVETRAQFKRVKALGVSYSQGYLHSKPLPIDQLDQFLSNETNRVID